MLGQPTRQRLGGAGLLVDQVGAVVAQTEGTGIEQLMNGSEHRHGRKEVLFNFSKIGCCVKHDQPRNLVQVERDVRCALQRFKHVPHDQRW